MIAKDIISRDALKRLTTDFAHRLLGLEAEAVELLESRNQRVEDRRAMAGIDTHSGRTTAALSLLVLAFAATDIAATSVYRCISPAGDLEFRQTPCTDGAEGREVRVED